MPVEGRVEVISGLLNECDRQAENPPSVNGVPDRYISMFAVALKNSLEYLPECSQDQLAVAVNVKKKNGPFPSEYAFNYILRNIQMDLMHEPGNFEAYDPFYPYETSEEWNVRVQEKIYDEQEFKKLTQNMIMWNVGSDVETRVAGLKLVAHVLQPDRVNDPEDPFTILNVGSARNHALAMLSGNVDLAEVVVTRRELGQEKQKYLQERVNQFLATRITMGDSYGVDVRSLKDEEWGYLLEACRFYPSELRDREKRKRYKMLEGIRDADPRIHHAFAIYGEDRPVEDKNFDIVGFLTSMYQSYQDKRRNMFDMALSQHIKAGGKIVVQDFCEIREIEELDHPLDKLDFLGPTSKPYTYGTFVYDTEKPERGFQLFGYWNNGRCEKFNPGDLFLESVA